MYHLQFPENILRIEQEEQNNASHNQIFQRLGYSDMKLLKLIHFQDLEMKFTLQVELNDYDHWPLGEYPSANVFYAIYLR